MVLRCLITFLEAGQLFQVSSICMRLEKEVIPKNTRRSDYLWEVEILWLLMCGGKSVLLKIVNLYFFMFAMVNLGM